MSTTTIVAARGAQRRLVAAYPQLSGAAAQLLAGAGNLLYAILVARLTPDGYGQVAAFLGAYLLVHLPLTSATAAASLRPARLAALRRGLTGAGVAGAALLAALAAFGPDVGFDPALVLALAAALPVAGLLAIERGRLLGARADGRFAATLVVEPVVRLGCGIALTLVLGPLGAVIGVVAGGYAALLVAATGATAIDATTVGSGTAPPGGRAVAGTFAGLAVVQTQDVVLAGALLASAPAAGFGALSTLGGMAAFATATVPLVLVPRAVAGEPRALRNAVLTAAGLGAAAVLPALVAPRLLVTTLFGPEYAEVAGLAAPYLLAMALLGVARVLLAHRAAVGSGRALAVLLAAAAALQALLVLSAQTPAGVVTATTAAAGLLLTGAVLLERFAPSRVVAPPPAPAAAPAPAPRRAPRRDARLVGGLMLAALAIRAVCGRSLWLDEATSVSQAQMPFGEMLERLRVSDVHPPLHDAILWCLAHTLGTDATVMRAPSLVAGTALVGVLYLAGRELWDRRAGIAAATFAVVAPFAIWYSQEARMYELFMLFAALSIYGQARVLRRGDRAGWLCWIAATALLAWTHYFALLAVAVQVGAFAVVMVARRRRGEAVKPLLIGLLTALAAIAVLCAPLVAFAHAQYAANEASGRGFDQTPSQTGEAGHGVPGPYAVLTNLAWALWGYHSGSVMARLTALWPLLMLLALALMGRGRDRGGRLLWAMVLVPLAGLLVLGHAKPFLFEARYFAAAVPALLLLVAHATTRWARHGAVSFAAVALAASSFAVAAADQQLSRTNPRLYDFRGALARVQAVARPGDAVLYTPAHLNDLIGYYAPDLRARALPKQRLPRVAPGRRIFLLSSFQDDPANAARTDAALALLARKHRFERVIRRPQVEVWVYR